MKIFRTTFSSLTNITNDMVKDAPELEPKLREFIDFIGDAVLVAHNARFDMGFIQAACRRLGMPEVKNPVLDTLELARFLHSHDEKSSTEYIVR